MAVNMETDCVVVEETQNEGGIDGDYTTCLMPVDVERNVLRWMKFQLDRKMDCRQRMFAIYDDFCGFHGELS